MNVLFASSECEPFAKTGGLADVCSALPRQLAESGHRVCIFLPAYRCALEAGPNVEDTGIKFQISMGSQDLQGSLLRSRLPQTGIPVYLVQQDDYFDRPGLYQQDGIDYDDNCARFVFFNRAIIESIEQLGLDVDLIHCNDWQTGLLPAILSTEYASVPGYENIASLLTIHNLGYQGMFWHWDMLLTGLDWKYFNWKQMEFYGQLNLLKTGIVFADAISTVSPTYAKEIQTAEYGCGLENTIRHRRSNLSGILNGIDRDWDPESDRHIKANYNVTNWKLHKPKCKWDLQKELGLAIEDIPVIGLVGRMADQKGWSLILETMQHWLPAVDVQWAILGTGHRDFETQLKMFAEKHPGKLGLRLGFDQGLARRVEAGADLFLMPSQYEPCGLNQMYSLKYGTVPVVHATGGLADTVIPLTEKTRQDQTANGFAFGPFSAESLEAILTEAIRVFCEQPELWSQLVETGMRCDHSWRHRAREYEALYERTILIKKSAKPQPA